MRGAYALRASTGCGGPPARLSREPSLAGLGSLTGDLRIDTGVVERPGDDRHDQRAGLGAVVRAMTVVVPLACGDGADNEPQEDHCSGDLHCYLQGLCPLVEARDAGGRASGSANNQRLLSWTRP